MCRCLIDLWMFSIALAVIGWIVLKELKLFFSGIFVFLQNISLCTMNLINYPE